MLKNWCVVRLGAALRDGVIGAIHSIGETSRRKASPPQFDYKLSQQDFIDIAGRIAKNTPRVSQVVATGLTVVLRVQSNTGLTSWTAEIDFNDYGKPSGRYWISSQNSQSPIPEFFAKAVGEELARRAG